MYANVSGQAVCLALHSGGIPQPDPSPIFAGGLMGSMSSGESAKSFLLLLFVVARIDMSFTLFS